MTRLCKQRWTSRKAALWVCLCAWHKRRKGDEILVDTSQWIKIKWRECWPICLERKEERGVRKCAHERRGRGERCPGWWRKAHQANRGTLTTLQCPVSPTVFTFLWTIVTLTGCCQGVDVDWKRNYSVLVTAKSVMVWRPLFTCCYVMTVWMICCVQLCCDLFSLISTVKAQTKDVKTYFFLWLYLYLVTKRKKEKKQEFLLPNCCVVSVWVNCIFISFLAYFPCVYVSVCVHGYLYHNHSQHQLVETFFLTVAMGFLWVCLLFFTMKYYMWAYWRLAAFQWMPQIPLLF